MTIGETLNILCPEIFFNRKGGVKKSVPMKERKVSLIGKEKDTYKVKKTVPVMDRKVSPNKISISYLICSKIKRESICSIKKGITSIMVIPFYSHLTNFS